MSIQQNLKELKQLIQQAESESNRKPEEVLFLAVSKQQTIAAIQEAYRLGISHFGESYLQEALPKINELKTLPLCWHFIGPIQKNKAKGIANYFSWVHSVNRIQIARILSENRQKDLDPINVCIQVNIVDEPTKSGVQLQEVASLAQEISQLPQLKLRGLMTIPPPQTNPQAQFELFLQLNHFMYKLNIQLGLSMDTLSMGMSDDFVPAIKAGATIIRIGQALFGERQR